ncbi:hypothetical protein ABBQ32_011103 [Trebouxia sp. C0010 RCD-2024]
MSTRSAGTALSIALSYCLHPLAAHVIQITLPYQPHECCKLQMAIASCPGHVCLCIMRSLSYNACTVLLVSPIVSNMSHPHLGDRAQIADCKATVRYVGEVDGQNGTWVGLDWDSAARGKNDGSTGGRSYFQCSAPGSGSFVRLAKFHAQTEPTATILAAVQARYGDQETDRAKEEASPASMPGPKKGVHWQFIGAEKVHARLSQLQTLEEATLINCRISCVGDEAELRDSLPMLHELDLTGNLLSSWYSLQQIGSALPSLSMLNLSQNVLTPPDSATSSSMPPNAALRTLVLNDCRLTWSQVVSIQASVPSLQELHLCHNDITTLSAPDPGEPVFLQLQVRQFAADNIARGLLQSCSTKKCCKKIGRAHKAWHMSPCYDSAVVGLGGQLPDRLGRSDACVSIALSEAPLAWRQQTAACAAASRHRCISASAHHLAARQQVEQVGRCGQPQQAASSDRPAPDRQPYPP